MAAHCSGCSACFESHKSLDKPVTETGAMNRGAARVLKSGSSSARPTVARRVLLARIHRLHRLSCQKRNTIWPSVAVRAN